MGDSDAEWVGVDFEFGKVDPPRTTTAKPVTSRPRPPPRPFTEKPHVFTTREPHDSPEVAGPPTNPTKDPNMTTLLAGIGGGIIGIVLLMLLVYMLVLRRRLNKAKVASTDSQYQLRVEDVAHLTHLDETSNTYVNTTDLQKLLSSVRAKKKAEERPPTMPKIQHQTPTPYRSASNPKPNSDNNLCDNTGFSSDPDVVVVRAPMPIPHGKTELENTCNVEAKWKPKPVEDTEALYSNIEPAEPFKLNKPPSRRKAGAPSVSPPPPPMKKKESSLDNHIEQETPVSPTSILRPAPPPPVLNKKKSVEAMDPPKVQKPLLPAISKPTPPVAPKPNKNQSQKPLDTKPVPPAVSKPTPPPVFESASPPANKPTPPAFKPTPPVTAKPGVAKKGKNLPPLKMALLPSLSKSSLDNCSTPDTGIIELTPESTPTPEMEGTQVKASVSSKIAFLEGKMKTPILPTRALPQKT